MYGLMIAFFYYSAIIKYHSLQALTSSFLTSPSSSIFYLKFYNYLPRDLLANAILAIYLSYLLTELLKSAVGLNNPFINNKYDTQFQLLIPINPYVSFISRKVDLAIRNLIMVILLTTFVLGPTFILLQFSLSRLIVLIINFFFGIELISLLGNLIFFAFNSIRSEKDLAVLFVDKSRIILSTTTFVFPVIFLQLLNDNKLLSFQALSNYYLVPFVNLAVSNTGFLLRSGVPLVAYLSSVTLIVEVLALFVIILILIYYYQSSAEMGDLLPILEAFDSKQQKIFISEEDMLSDNISKVSQNKHFPYLKTSYSLIIKDLISFTRNYDLKGNLYASMACSIFVTTLLFARVDFSSGFGMPILLFCLMSLIAYVLDTMVRGFYSISLNEELLNIDTKTNRKIKIAFLLVASFPVWLLLIGRISFSIPILVIIIYITSELLNKGNVRNRQVEMIISLIMTSIFISLLFII